MYGFFFSSFLLFLYFLVPVLVFLLAFCDITPLPYTNHMLFLPSTLTTSQTNIGPMIVSVNPFKRIPIFSDDHIEHYKRADGLEGLPPHIFSIPKVVKQDLQKTGRSQSIIISGESGAGKTEATKLILKYFSHSTGGDREHCMWLNLEILFVVVVVAIVVLPLSLCCYCHCYCHYHCHCYCHCP